MARIILIDDEEVVRKTTRRALERAGHEVVEASDARYLRRFETEPRVRGERRSAFAGRVVALSPDCPPQLETTATFISTTAAH